ncbi:MAG: ABC transporter ATP-binding protein [Devosia sp.]|nr:ABC transporter ATP-binding protein [Devosia sp.]
MTNDAVAAQSASPTLDVRGLSVAFRRRNGLVRVVRDVDLTLGPGEVLGLVGESGSGKSILARAVLGTLPRQAEVLGGSIAFSGGDLMRMPPSQVRRLRGDRIAIVPQEPMTSLNPSLRIGRQLTEVLEVHRPEIRSKERSVRAVEMLDLVGVTYADERLAQYPHQLSGGLRQRVAIAMALICGRVELLIADEPTTALDVTIQAQILDLFVRLQKSQRMSVLLITHDLGVIAQTAQRVAVMYAGEIVEVADVNDLFASPRHPYTRGLLDSLPRSGRVARKSHLPSIEGSVPSPSAAVRDGCSFADRCAFRIAICDQQAPPLDSAGLGRSVRCHRWADLTAGFARRDALL